MIQKNLAWIYQNKLVQAGLGVPFFVIIILSMMILPVPTIILDFCFTFNITLSLLILLAGVYASRPLDFAVFPTILLVTTLMRLALNIASTRVILLYGHQGHASAGQVIDSFAHVVIGGNYVVGFIVFLILIIINFVVITKGAGRVSEVSARFTLDAMPGKQMAIDADLNAGVINQEQAQQRRQDVSLEADFYGAMDGASKFVRGDAIAGILVLIINIVGGIPIGTLQHGLDFMDAIKIYALLSIGDGLVAQLPALLLSVASAILITRVSSTQDMGQQIVQQIFSSTKPMFIVSGILAILGIIPGMPHVAFLGLGAFVGGCAYWLYREQNPLLSEGAPIASAVSSGQQVSSGEASLASTEEGKQESTEQKEVSWEDVPPLDVISLEIGYRLIPMVEKEKGGELMSRIKGVRKKLSQELGFLIPSVHIRDDLHLMPTAYKISLMGVVIGEAEVHPEKDLAINPGQVFGTIEGIRTKDPAFGLEAVWIEKTKKEQAQTLGYTVVDASTVIATHLSQLLQEHAAQLLGHDEVQNIVELLKKTSSKLAEELVPNAITLSGLVKLLQHLLQEAIPIRDIRSIAETITEAGPSVQDVNVLVELVRERLGPLIVQQLNGSDPEIAVMAVDPSLEHILQQSLQTTAEQGIEPTLAERMQQSLKKFVQEQETFGKPSILLVAPAIRRMLARFVRSGVPGLSVLSFQEIPDSKSIKVIAVLGQAA